MTHSLLAMPNVSKDIWTASDASIEKGEVNHHSFNSRRIWSYTPFNYKESSDAFNLLVLTDGFDYLNYLSAKEVLDNLIYKKIIPPTVAIFIDNHKDRFQELTCNEGFSSYISKELIPWIWNNFKVTQNPQDTVIGGFNLGALTATYLAYKHPNIFGNALAQSASFWWNSEWLTQMVKSSDTLPVKFYLNVGIFENKPYDTEPIMMDAINNMYNVLLSKGYEIKYEQFQSGHDYLSWGETLAKGLIYFMGK
ncbi:esterase family protein [Clostridium sp. 19966]|uniref:alpha/beta hydrolase n=1 Tax=Clostridium sp. 19966 TaxID=2768166 RepID=UPI0028E05F70|nr:alpha/beta hydrolase-fold protein [Clostridium sp. 19966]MDT8719270.1 esterase family protein [Clostridium sp. 19966]